MISKKKCFFFYKYRLICAYCYFVKLVPEDKIQNLTFALLNLRGGSIGSNFTRMIVSFFTGSKVLITLD